MESRRKQTHHVLAFGPLPMPFCFKRSPAATNNDFRKQRHIAMMMILVLVLVLVLLLMMTALCPQASPRRPPSGAAPPRSAPGCRRLAPPRRGAHDSRCRAWWVCSLAACICVLHTRAYHTWTTWAPYRGSLSLSGISVGWSRRLGGCGSGGLCCPGVRARPRPARSGPTSREDDGYSPFLQELVFFCSQPPGQVLSSIRARALLCVEELHACPLTLRKRTLLRLSSS